LEVYSAAANSVCGGNPTCAITNSTAQTSEWQYLAKSNQNAGSNVIPVGAFFTGGVDLTFIFNLVGETVPCISSFLFDTRSSQSPSAVLKDFIGGSFPLCAIGASATCSVAPTYSVGPPAAIHYEVDGAVANQASGTLYGATVSATLPSGAYNVVITQPTSPLAGSASSPFKVNFDFPTEGVVSVSGSACAAAFPGGPCNVTTGTNGAPANWSANVGGAGCSISTNPTMSLTKSCVVNLTQSASGVFLQLYDTITVCNTDTKDTITNISLSNNVTNGPSADSVVTGLTLTAGKCQTYSPVYTPTACVGGVDPSGGGRCKFQDTVSVSSTPKDEFGNSLPAGAIPASQTANCAVCSAGACLP
jgi:hypothetical protein